jgi:hypothetical protein
MAVAPECAGLPRQWQFRNALGELVVVELPVEQMRLRIDLLHPFATDIFIADPRSMPEQVHDGHLPHGWDELQLRFALCTRPFQSYLHIGKRRDVF